MIYDKNQQAFFHTPKKDPLDRISLELGDSKQPDKFYPQVKIMRWDNEVNASFRLIDDEPKQLSTEDEKIKLIGAKKEVHFYEFPVSEEHPRGGFEFEVILKEKPISNKLEFSLETKGLNFFYQPPLNEEMEAPEGGTITQTEVRDKNGRLRNIRPENVVGGWAVYHSGRPVNYEGGKLYRTGQVGFIYRPKMVDSDGNWVWGELNIDVEKKLLTVTIPQEFLDTAVYPIRHASGLGFGYDTEGTSETVWDMIRTYRADPGGAETVAKISAFCKRAFTGDTPFITALYDAGQDKVSPTGGAVTVTTDVYTWWDSILSGGAGVTSQTYDICAWCGATLWIKYNSGGASGIGGMDDYAYTYPNWPATDIALNDTSWQFSIYATFEEAAAGPAGVKTINETAIASVKTIQETAIASVKTINESAA